jgi:putative transposase
MRRGFKFKLYPNSGQEAALSVALETHRRLYNAALEQRITAYETEKRSVGFSEQCRGLTERRKENAYLDRVNATGCQGTLRRLDHAFQSFFRHVREGTGKPGFPRFKGKDRFNSFAFPAYGDGVKLHVGEHPKLYVQHVGEVRIRLHRPVEGKIKTVTVKREAGKWYAVFSCELPDVAAPDRRADPATGIDLGLERFLTAADGSVVANPRFLKGSLPELRRRQRALARAKRGSGRRRKTKSRVTQCYARVANQRRDFHHKTALDLIRRYGFVAVEDLDVRELGSSGPHRMNRAIHDAGWSQFVGILKYKAESAGTRVVVVETRGTSQECSGCGTVVPKTLRDRKHTCPVCGLSLHRDENAARNILARGLRARTVPEGLNVDVGLHAPRSCLL